MKRLLLLRHAKSSRNDTSLADHDRPLTKRGEKDARRMGAYLEREELLPDRVLCSTAVRAVRSWEAASRKLSRDVPFTQVPELYTADAEGILRLVRGAAVEDQALLLIGHNPAFQELAAALFGSGDAAALTRMRRKFPTASIAVYHFDTDEWGAVAPGGGELERFVRPKQLQR